MSKGGSCNTITMSSLSIHGSEAKLFIMALYSAFLGSIDLPLNKVISIRVKLSVLVGVSQITPYRAHKSSLTYHNQGF